MPAKKIKLNKYGWKPDKPDKRDKYMSSYLVKKESDLPPLVDLREKMPFVYSQGNLGSCTGQSIAGVIHHRLIAQNGLVWQPSPLFIYYNERVIENTVEQDCGAELRDGMKSINKWGVCTEEEWPYIIEKFSKKPNAKAYKEASAHKVVEYARIPQSAVHLKSVLSEGYSFVFGFCVYESFESEEVTKTGIMPHPKDSERSLGGHAVAGVGYDDSRKVFIIRNSWGEMWGDKGYFYMPYDLLLDNNFADDFWMIKIVPNHS